LAQEILLAQANLPPAMAKQWVTVKPVARTVARAPAGGKAAGKGAGSWVWIPPGQDAGRAVAKIVRPVTRIARPMAVKPVVRSITRMVAKGGGKMGAKGGGKMGAKGGGKMGARPVSKYADKLKNTDASLKVWIGGLSEKTSWKTLEKHFEGSVAKPAITEIMGKGSAVVSYKSVEQVSEAVAALDGSELDGNSIQVDVWVEKPKSERPPRKAAPKLKPQPKQVVQPRKMLLKSGKDGKGAGKGKGKGKGDDKMKEKLAAFKASQKVWIGGLAESTTWKELEKHLAEIAKPKVTHIFRGKGVAAYENEEDATTIIAALNGSELAGNVLEIDTWTKPEREKKEVKGSVKAEI